MAVDVNAVGVGDGLGALGGHASLSGKGGPLADRVADLVSGSNSLASCPWGSGLSLIGRPEAEPLVIPSDSGIETQSHVFKKTMISDDKRPGPLRRE